MLREIIAFGVGFTAGIIYTSNKYDHNPNEVFDSWKKSAVDAGEVAKNKVKEVAEDVKNKATKSEVVEAQVVTE